MRKGIYVLPNSLTLCGMLAGFYAIVTVFKADYTLACWAVLIAAVFDGLDGWVARLTNSTTKFGIELDSLSDVIAFGVAPAALLYKWALYPFGRVGWAAAFLFTACGALRLARYNVQMGSTERKSFTGMPIPGAAIVVVTMVLFYSALDLRHTGSYFALFMTFLLSILMVSTLRFHGAKEIDFSKRKPFWLLVAVVVIFVLVAMHPAISLFIFAMLYLVGGLAENLYLYMRKRKAAAP
ncbi:MAG: CDP-diacylglycerol--serine O-phosphatidyltransferase [Thermodesulfovibrionales bacterium]